MTATTTITRVATEGVDVKCPPWCEVTQAEHLDELVEAECWATHISATLPLSDVPDGPSVRLNLTATPDGRIVDPEGRLRFHVRMGGDGLDTAAMARLHELVDTTERPIA